MTTYTITGTTTVVGTTTSDTFNVSGAVSNTSLTGSDTTAVAGNDSDQFLLGTATLSGGVTIDGGVGQDYLYNSYGGTTTLQNGQLIVKNVEGISGDLTVKGNSTYDLSGSTATSVSGNINAVDAGNFLYLGSNQADNVYLGGGSDTIYGGGGGDYLYGASGNSLIYGGAGDDQIRFIQDAVITGTVVYGGTENDTTYFGKTTITGGATIDGGAGTSDTVYFSNGSSPTTLASSTLIINNVETLSGPLNVTGNSTLDLTGSPTASMGQINADDAGNFLFTGSAGGDVVYAGGGSDTIYGGAASDTFYAGGGAGRYYGGAEHDNLYFVAGRDITGTYADMGAASIDAVGGTSELDYVFFSTDYTKPSQVNNGTLRIDNAQAIGYWLDVNGNSTVDLSNSTTTGSGMNNWLNLNDAGNAGISGTQAYDIIYINGGSDTVCAQGGTDVIYVGSGVNHVAKGGAGADQFYLYNDDYQHTVLGAATYTGDVRIDGGTESDVVYLSYGSNRTVIQGGSLTITNVEQMSGYLQMNDTATLDVSQVTSGNMYVVGDNTANVIYGSNGGSDDVTFGSANDYYFWSGKANGAIRGGNGVDTFAYMVGGVRTVTNAANGDGYVTMPGGTTIYYYGFENFVETTTSPVPTPAALPPCPSVPIPNSPDGIVDGLETGQVMGAGFIDAQNDIIDGADGVNDIIKGNGGNDTIDAGAGNDTVYGGNDNDVITGGAGNDVIYGDAGSDTLAGGLGNDTLDGGLGDDDIALGGADSALGGSGDDVFTLDSTDTATDINATIAGGETGEDVTDPANGGAGDVLDLSSSTAALTVTLGTNPESGTINGLDGDAGADITFAEIEKVLTGTGADSINGSAAAGPLNVDSGTGNDTIAAGSGNDTIAAGTGNDVVDAGAGNDLVYGGGDNDTVAGGAGNDTIYGGDGADSLAGGAGNDTIYGDLGDDDLILGAGDAAFGGSGDDVFTFDGALTGNATISVDGGSDGTSGNPDDAANFDAGDVLDLRGLSNVVITYGGGNNESGTATYKNAANEVVTINFSEIESVLRDPPGVVDGTSGADTMGPGFTDAQGDQIDGADGLNDTVSGGLGNDTIDAGQGDDTVYGGDGTDNLTGGVGNDLLYGGNDADTVAGGAGNDTLNGDAGADSLDGGADNDLIYGGADNDTLLGGAGNDSLFGDAGSDSLTGGAGNDTLDGGLGDDKIALGGADSALGGSGDDLFTLDATDPATDINATITGGELGEDLTDPTNGGAGDSLDLTAVTGPLTVVYGANSESGTVNGLDGDAAADITFTEIEKVLTGTGSDSINASAATGPINVDTGAGNDTIATGAGDNILTAGTGNDVVDSGAGNDLVYAGTGNDSLTGGTGNDTLYGGDSSDTLSGGAGNDTLYGDQGDDDIMAGAGDAVYGGSGDDVFTFDRTLAGNATITVDGGSDATSGNPDDTANGDAGDVLDLRGQTNVNITYNTADPTYSAITGTGESGVATYTNSAGQTVTVNFSEIESVQRDAAGPVDGTVGDDVIGAGFKDGQNDQIDGTDGANDIVYGGLGNDSIAAGLGNDTVYGGSDNDTVDGWVGSDVIYGGDGNDLLKDSDANRDTIYGGAGDDTYDPTGNGSASDVVYLDAGDDKAILGLITTGVNESIDGGSGNDTFDYSSFPTSTINVTIRPDGSLDFGGTISANNVYTNFENITGNNANNVITGNLADNVLDGGAGADTLTAGAGSDTVLGGTGNDLIYGGDGADRVIGGAGNDTLYGDLGDDDIAVGGSDVAFGGSGDDVFTIDGTDTATNLNTTITGGETGEDLTDPSNGGAGDSLDLSAATGPLTVVYGTNPESGTVNGLDGDAGVDITFAEIEKVLTGTGSDSINAASATGPINIDTGAGNDTISTGSGDNTVTAGTGNDVVDAGAGNDLVYGGDGNDSVAGGTGNDTIYGGDASDTLSGGAGNDVLDGGLGDDDILAGAGDTVKGGSGDDVFTFDSALTGNATISVDGGSDATSGNPDDAANFDAGDILDLRGLSNVVITYGGGNNESGTATYKNAANEVVTINFSEIESVLRDPPGVVDGTSGADTMGPGFTDAQGDQIDGADGLNDTVSGGLGNDAIDAGQGDDTVYGGDGTDSLSGGVGNDLLYGGNDADTVAGGAGNDTLYGDAGADSLDGGADNDLIYGGADNDTLLGGAGNDSLFGDAGSDSLTGGAGNDTLDGGLGDDKIALGGADSALGGSGDDLFTLDATDTATDINATITGGELGEDLTDPTNGGSGDVLNLSGSTAGLTVTLGANPESGTINGLDGDAGADITFSEIEKVLTGTGADTIAGGSATGPINADTGAGNDSIATGSGNDTIAAGAGNDSIDAGAGNDLVYGGDNNDTVAGGAGNDTIYGGDGSDSLSGGAGNDTLDGGLGDDRLVLGAGDTADGGSGDDIFTFDKNLTGTSAITVIGGESGQDLTDPTNGGAGDILNLSGLGPVTIVYDQTDASWNGTTSEKGVATYQNAEGQAVNINFSQIESVVVCFAAGTMIETAEGEVAIEHLQPGDLVRTADHDYQPIRWIGSSTVPARGAVAPILIKAGALGNARDLRVSPQHRMLLGGWQAEMLFGEPEVLVAAKHLVNDQSILRDEGGMVAYFHMMFDTHEIVFAEGAPSESFHSGQEGWGALAEAARAEILALFPALLDGQFDSYGASARRTLRAHEAKTAVGLIF